MINLDVSIVTIGSPRDNSKIRLSWEVDHHSVNQYEVYKSSDRENFTLVATVTSPLVEYGSLRRKEYEYNDTEINLRVHGRHYYYKVKAILENGNTKEWSKIETWNSKLRIHEFQIITQQEYYFKNQAGFPLFWYQRKKGMTQRCPDCWDTTLQKVNNIDANSCPICFGTGTVNPFYEGTLMWVSDTAPVVKDAQLSEMGRQENFEKGKVFCNGFPRVHESDLFYDPVDAKFYNVKNVVRVGRKHAEVLQIISLQKQPAESGEYKFITENKSILDQLTRELREINQERRF